jgi:hypothetical protein
MKKAIVPICVILFILFLGCYLIIMEYAKERADLKVENELKQQEEEKGEETEPEPDEGVQGLLIDIDESVHMMSFEDISTGKSYRLPYEEGIDIRSKHDEMMTFAQLEPGEIYSLYYTRSVKKLTGLKVSDKVWTYTDVTRFSFDERKKIMTIGDESYKFNDGLKIFSGGKEARIMDVTELDTLIVRGIDKQVLSVVVDKGHGYIRVLNDAYFVGGWIEIGQEIIKPVTDDMLIPVGEGQYTVTVTNRGYAGQEELTIRRDEETKFDLSKIEIEEVAIGHIKFSITPDYARLYIDDEITEYTDRVPVEYGIHALRVECAGYETINSNIKVGSEYAEIEITMDEESDSVNSASSSSSSSTATLSANTANTTSSSSTTASSSSSSTSGSVSGNSLSGNKAVSKNSSVISSEKKIYVEQPSGCEVYLDGNYIGIAPAQTSKVTGSHVITLSRDGYKTRSYTVNIANDGNDITFSFSGLSAE